MVADRYLKVLLPGQLLDAFEVPDTAEELEDQQNDSLILGFLATDRTDVPSESGCLSSHPSSHMFWALPGMGLILFSGNVQGLAGLPLNKREENKQKHTGYLFTKSLNYFWRYHGALESSVKDKWSQMKGTWVVAAPPALWACLMLEELRMVVFHARKSADYQPMSRMNDGSHFCFLWPQCRTISLVILESRMN